MIFSSFVGFVISCALTLSLCSLAYKIFLENKVSPAINRIMILVIYFMMVLVPMSVNLSMPAIVTKLSAVITSPIIIDNLTVGLFDSSEVTKYEISDILLVLYLTGIAFMSILTFIDLVKLLKIHWGSTPMTIDGVEVFIHDRNDLSPFSWLNRIYVNKMLLNMEKRDFTTLLIHEFSHVKRFHYIDLILAQVVLIFQWFNPVAWKLKKEIKMLHEYEADAKVLASGVDEIGYQNLLITNLVKTQIAGISHSLNDCSLKKRILMMQRNGFSRGVTFRIMAVLFACVLAGNILNIPVVSSSLRKSTLNSVSSEYSGIALVPFSLYDWNRKESRKSYMESRVLYDNPDVLPVYGKDNESMAALMNDLSRIITYPENAERNGIQGKVVVEFVVTKEGNMESFKIVKSVDPELDQNAIEAIKALPRKWQPGFVDGTPVDCYFNLPISYRLQKSA